MTNKILVDKDYLDGLLADYQATLNKLDLASGKEALEIAEHAQDIAEQRLNRIHVLEREVDVLKTAYDNIYGYGQASRLLAFMNKL